MKKNNNHIRHSSLKDIASAFIQSQEITDIKRITSGLVNDTFLVSYLLEGINKSFIIQRINISIFDKPLSILSNYNLILEAQENKQAFINNLLSVRSKEFIIPPLLINRVTSKSFYKSGQYYWRAFEYIPSSITHTSISDPKYSFSILQSLSIFHYLSSNIDTYKLKLILPNFHNSPAYLIDFEEAMSTKYNNKLELNQRFLNLVDFIKLNRDNCSLLEAAKKDNTLSFTAIHGDPKVSNFIFDQSTSEVLSIIDLDTFQPGFLLYDLADCMRSCCNPAGEETNISKSVKFDLNLYQSALKGYISLGLFELSNADKFYLPYALRAVTFELGIRFFTDFIRGNIYFNTSYQGHNLLRAENQFQLLRSISSQWNDIVGITGRIISQSS